MHDMIDDEVASENYMVREKSIQYPGGGDYTDERQRIENWFWLIKSRYLTSHDTYLLSTIRYYIGFSNTYDLLRGQFIYYITHTKNLHLLLSWSVYIIDTYEFNIFVCILCDGLLLVLMLVSLSICRKESKVC